jgi:putative peptide zinc metalloprotease protein
VLAPGELRVRAALPDTDAGWLQHSHEAVEVRLADAPGEVLAATRSGSTPAATHQLPSAALAETGGGPFPIDPQEKDGLHTLQPVFLVDLRLPSHPLARVGGRAWVRFEQGGQPLAAQAWRRASQIFLQHFTPAA